MRSSLFLHKTNEWSRNLCLEITFEILDLTREQFEHISTTRFRHRSTDFARPVQVSVIERKKEELRCYVFTCDKDCPFFSFLSLTTELSFLVILQILARAGLVGVYKKCSLVKMNHQ